MYEIVSLSVWQLVMCVTLAVAAGAGIACHCLLRYDAYASRVGLDLQDAEIECNCGTTNDRMHRIACPRYFCHVLRGIHIGGENVIGGTRCCRVGPRTWWIGENHDAVNLVEAVEKLCSRRYGDAGADTSERGSQSAIPVAANERSGSPPADALDVDAVRKAILSCNGCGEPLVHGEHVICSDCLLELLPEEQDRRTREATTPADRGMAENPVWQAQAAGETGVNITEEDRTEGT